MLALNSSIITTNQITEKDDDKMYFINLKSKSLSYVYLTDRYDHFVKVTEAFNKGRNEMIQSERLLDSRLSSPSNNNGDSKEEKRQLRESLRNSGNYKEGVTDDAGGAATGGGRKSAGTLIEIVLITFYMIYLLEYIHVIDHKI